tara:strand:+ start:6344 stop:7144 length:801 start_codon:yes stop_codon:yes gene_type:complete
MKPWREAFFAQAQMASGDIEQTIKDFVITAFRKAQRDALWKNSGTRLDTWHVSDFVSPCLRKSHYSKIPELKKEMTDEMASILFQGVIVHDNAILGSINELTMCYDIEKRENIDPSTVKAMEKDDPRKKDIITGTLDDLLRIGNEFVIADKKTYNARGYVKKEASPEHILQVNIYKLMLKYSYGIEANYGCNLYLDKGNGYATLPLVYRTAPVAETQEFLAKTLKMFKSGLPDPTITFLCNGENKDKKIYCNFLDQCKKDGRENFV